MSEQKRCHGCKHPVEAHIDFEGCTYGKPKTICWCHFTPAWAGTEQRAAAATEEGVTT